MNPNDLSDRLAALLGQKPISWRSVSGGYTPAERWLVDLDDGGSIFVKAATDSATASWLRREHQMYDALQAPFMPRMLGWDDDGDRPFLVLEDLSAAYWPPPWTMARVDAVRETLSRLADRPIPEFVPSFTDAHPDFNTGWSTVAADPEAFLSLGLCRAAWLDAALPTLVAAESEAILEGDALLHADVRSDNLCFRNDRTLLIDWNWAARGHPLLDVAFWLPSLHAEGGPRPETILPDAPELAALVSGFFAARAGLPGIPRAPHVRSIQRTQLRTALPWAVRSLGLPVHDSRDVHGPSLGRR